MFILTIVKLFNCLDLGSKHDEVWICNYKHCWFIVFFIGSGLINEHDSQLKAKYKLKENIELYFKTKDEIVIKVSSIDYSLGQIETSVETNKNTYYVVADDITPLFFRYTVFDYFTDQALKFVVYLSNKGLFR